MEIKIDSDELVYIQNQLKELKNEKIALESQLKAYKDSELESKVQRAARALFDEYIKEVFKQLGFENAYPGTVDFDCYLHGSERGEWHTVDNVKVTLGASVYGEFMNAFIKIGIIPKTELEIKKSSILEKYS